MSSLADSSVLPRAVTRPASAPRRGERQRDILPARRLGTSPVEPICVHWRAAVQPKRAAASLARRPKPWSDRHPIGKQADFSTPLLTRVKLAFHLSAGRKFCPVSELTIPPIFLSPAAEPPLASRPAA